MFSFTKHFGGPKSFARYLQAKQTIDDRALHVPTQVALRGALTAFHGRPLRVLEIGSGLGNMLPRLLERNILNGIPEIHYQGIDIDSHLVGLATKAAAERYSVLGWSWVRQVEGETHLQRGSCELRIHYSAASLDEWCADFPKLKQYDLVIGQAVLDILDAKQATVQALSLLRDGGYFYFPIHFDGNTIFTPEIDSELDREIEALYHRTMDERLVNGVRSGDSRTGRHLFDMLARTGGEVVAAGGSSWVVHGKAGGYPAEEAYFLHYIVDGVYQEVARFDEIAQDSLLHWASTRHGQIQRGELVYIAHQLDLFGQCRKAPT